MASSDAAAEGALPSHQLDPGSQEWVQALAGTGAQREAALARLHEMLLRIARGELHLGGHLRGYLSSAHVRRVS